MENCSYKNEIAVNDKKIKDETVFNQLYQNQTVLYWLSHWICITNQIGLYLSAKFTNNPEKFRRKSKWLSEKQVAKSFWYYMDDF
jgi:hypothetical protein